MQARGDRLAGRRAQNASKGPSALLAVLILSLGCSTAMPGGATASDAWGALVAQRDGFEGARSYMKVRVRSDLLRRSFNAKLFVDRQGRVLLTGLSPLGTALFTLYVDDDDALVVDHHERTFWQGSVADLADVAGLQGAFRARGLGFILLGLPPRDYGSPELSSSDGKYGEVRAAGWDLLVSAFGLAEARASGIDARARFDLPSIPPTRVILDSGSEQDGFIEIEHLDLGFGPTDVSRPEIDPDYTAAPVR